MMQDKLYDILLSPMYTEKATADNQNLKYIFKVLKSATKQQIQSAVETIFNVKVLKVNIINCKGKAITFKGVKGRKKGYKKAILTFQSGENLEFITGA